MVHKKLKEQFEPVNFQYSKFSFTLWLVSSFAASNYLESRQSILSSTKLAPDPADYVAIKGFLLTPRVIIQATPNRGLTTHPWIISLGVFHRIPSYLRLLVEPYLGIFSIHQWPLCSIFLDDCIYSDNTESHMLAWSIISESNDHHLVASPFYYFSGCRRLWKVALIKWTYALCSNANQSAIDSSYQWSMIFVDVSWFMALCVRLAFARGRCELASRVASFDFLE